MAATFSSNPSRAARFSAPYTSAILRVPRRGRLVQAGAGATYAPSGHLLFAMGRPAEATLLAQPFDPKRLTLSGNPVPVAEAVTAGLDPGGAALSVSAGGIIAFRPDSGTGQGQLVWFDRSGKEMGKLGNPDSASSLNPIAVSRRSTRRLKALDRRGHRHLAAGHKD